MHYWHISNGIISAIAALVMAAIVMHPRIDEGLLTKLGLITMTFSLFATAYLSLTESENLVAYWRAAFWLRAGLLFTVFGVCARHHGWFGGPKRQLNDWMKCNRTSHRNRRADV